ncbi:ABC transporter permease subunit [Mesoplasma photuris]|uniref:ABC transporter permease subunit n=1 Tax=Mesoplasma photuris TaxID=217731 RepID=UPI0004E0FA7B|nr:ABC transporter permease subunit [Mesoplasma photuris]
MNLHFKKARVLITHFKLQYKLILFFMLIFSAITGILIYINSSEQLFHYIASTRVREWIGGNEWNLPHQIITDENGFSSTITLLFGTIGIIFFTVQSIIFSFLNFNREIKNKQISLWILSGINRKSLFLNKVIYTWLIIIFVFFPSFLGIVIYSSFAEDAQQLIGNVFADCLLFIVINIFIASLINFLSIKTKENTTIFFVIVGIFIAYMISSYILINIYESSYGDKFPLEMDNQNNVTYYFGFLKYISIFELYKPTLEFYTIDISEIKSKTNWYGWEPTVAVVESLNYKNITLVILFPIINFMATQILNFLSYKDYKKININI